MLLCKPRLICLLHIHWWQRVNFDLSLGWFLLAHQVAMAIIDWNNRWPYKERWLLLRLCELFRVTHTQMYNFNYDWCVSWSRPPMYCCKSKQFSYTLKTFGFTVLLNFTKYRLSIISFIDLSNYSFMDLSNYSFMDFIMKNFNGAQSLQFYGPQH